MYRIDNPSAVVTLQAPGPPRTPGFFTDGNPAAGLEATIVDAWWMNQLQEEIISVIRAANITLNKASHTQLLDALVALGLGAGVGVEGQFLPLRGGTLRRQPGGGGNPLTISAEGGQSACILAQVDGQPLWEFGQGSGGHFRIFNSTRASLCLSIDKDTSDVNIIGNDLGLAGSAPVQYITRPNETQSLVFCRKAGGNISSFGVLANTIDLQAGMTATTWTADLYNNNFWTNAIRARTGAGLSFIDRCNFAGDVHIGGSVVANWAWLGNGLFSGSDITLGRETVEAYIVRPEGWQTINLAGAGAGWIAGVNVYAHNSSYSGNLSVGGQMSATTAVIGTVTATTGIFNSNVNVYGSGIWVPNGNISAATSNINSGRFNVGLDVAGTGLHVENGVWASFEGPVACSRSVAATQGFNGGSNGSHYAQDGYYYNHVFNGTAYAGYLTLTSNLIVYGWAAKPGGGEWSGTSARAMKQDIAPYQRGLAEICQLEPVSFRYSERAPKECQNGETYYGLIADDVADIMPEMVSSDLMLDATALKFALVNAVKELTARIEALETKGA